MHIAFFSNIDAHFCNCLIIILHCHFLNSLSYLYNIVHYCDILVLLTQYCDHKTYRIRNSRDYKKKPSFSYLKSRRRYKFLTINVKQRRQREESTKEFALWPLTNSRTYSPSQLHFLRALQLMFYLARYINRSIFISALFPHFSLILQVYSQFFTPPAWSEFIGLPNVRRHTHTHTRTHSHSPGVNVDEDRAEVLGCAGQQVAVAVQPEQGQLHLQG